LDDGELDAIVLACAGLIRLGLKTRITGFMAESVSLPAVGQGVIGIECRSGDAGVLARLAPLNDLATRSAIDAERAFAARLGGSCQSPIGALARAQGEALELTGLVGEPDGSMLYRDSLRGAATAPRVLGTRLAERLLATGAGALLERLRA
jgi:hydroxymethylbilane synthase